MAFPSAIAFTLLKSLSISLERQNSTQFQQLLSELCCLEYLQLVVYAGVDCLSSRSVKKLDLHLFSNFPEPDSLGLSMPSLKFLRLENFLTLANVPRIHGEIPLIRKAAVTLHYLCQKHVTAVAQFLNCISHVEELTLDLEEHRVEDDPFPVLMEPDEEVSAFPYLKHLGVSMCFHEYNLETVIKMLHHSTALESLKLHHKAHHMVYVESGKRNAWRSKLPHNSDGFGRYKPRGGRGGGDGQFSYLVQGMKIWERSAEGRACLKAFLYSSFIYSVLRFCCLVLYENCFC